MLRSLAIRDFVLIPHIELSFGEGLTVITGETGAGKSALLEALRLLLGGRAEPDLVRSGAARAGLEALFDLPAEHPVRGLLAERDYPVDDELLVRRTIRPGRARASKSRSTGAWRPPPSCARSRAGWSRFPASTSSGR